MLVVKIEVHPGGDSSQADEIYRIELANISDLARVSDYTGQLIEDDIKHPLFHVANHKRADGPLELVYKTLHKLLRK